ncbi:hydantoinase/oxoprolinase N-terminal domain-containing protein [Kiloniella laminariae]|uniref:hydantoinase/oxoprolinase N-terminal domain-containing protein n=1 Tax=Kiloniella laminariae TaxID=454162 RepID=UPI00035DBB4D|nr:hydantoinase/oxoprolinase family protein [Kiloniella laminariae]
MLLGIDTGGTYTDAVLFTEEDGVIKTSKSLTTKHDLSIGICKAVDAILPGSGEEIRMVSLSTTLATNAIVESHGSPVCLIMIGYDEGSLMRSNLGEAIGKNPYVFVQGGHTSMGDEQAPLDLAAVRKTVLEQGPKVAAFAVAGYFSVRNAAHEEAVRTLIREETGLPVTCAHELTSSLDAPRRALTAVLNARLIPQLQQLILAVGTMLEQKNIKAPLMVVKGDGSLITAETALNRPVETILSGPAASVVGAHFLSGEKDVFVVDMGGTTTDIAILEDGQPLLNDQGALVGGWRTMVEAVAVHTFGLGGDSEVALEQGKAILTVGPRRVQPISLLALQYPEVLDVMQKQLKSDRIRPTDGRFVLRLRKLDTGETSLSRMEAEIWTLLKDGPVALNELAERPAMIPPLQRLVDRGLVIYSGLTPSDASHLLGRHQSWDVKGAELSAQLFLRFADRENIFRNVSVKELAEKIYEKTVTRSGTTILESAMSEEGYPALSKEQQLGQNLIENALRDKLTEKKSPLINFSLQLGRPIVAIGAPAATYYPDVAKRLNTRLSVPEHAEVTNAVGAVAGGVVQNVKALISSPEKGRYRVHISGAQKDFTDLELAATFATSTADQQVRDLALACGAAEVKVNITRKDKIILDAGGDKLFIESRIIAIAKGRPVLAA